MCHRLDKDTSGVLVMALNKRAHGRIGMVDLGDFRAKQILQVPNLQTSHGGIFATPDTKYVHISSKVPALKAWNAARGQTVTLDDHFYLRPRAITVTDGATGAPLQISAASSDQQESKGWSQLRRGSSRVWASLAISGTARSHIDSNHRIIASTHPR